MALAKIKQKSGQRVEHYIAR
ncbi:hypothetical protein CCACVL1_30990 [Corchorus capsularis]|uniref:Uncharacterized protein n=1 Tax=Corchorus capsularis TaxID=210143 RepID=A0A1R3FUF8_COCAP|nr:hypothetical protein CCACVL1_30990 [Corchorus capsularis]